MKEESTLLIWDSASPQNDRQPQITSAKVRVVFPVSHNLLGKNKKKGSKRIICFFFSFFFFFFTINPLNYCP